MSAFSDLGYAEERQVHVLKKSRRIISYITLKVTKANERMICLSIKQHSLEQATSWESFKSVVPAMLWS